MAGKKDKDNLPVHVKVEGENEGTITYANEVVAIIAGVATNEVEGIAGMCTIGGISDILGRNKNITRGVKVEIGSEEASIDLYIIVEYGTPIQKAASDVQENVRKAVESMTGLKVVRVDVHVQGVSFEKENKEAQQGLAAANASGAISAGEAQEKAAPKSAEERMTDIDSDIESYEKAAEEAKPAEEEPKSEAEQTVTSEETNETEVPAE